MRLAIRASWAVVALMLWWVPACEAATFNVTPDGTGDFATIQAAIDAAAPGDTVQLADGVFTGSGNRDLLFGGKPLTLRSAGGDAAACVIDAQGSESAPHRAAWLHDLPAPGALLEGITFRNGWNDGAGSGVYAYNCRVVARHCVFRDNRGAFYLGGAGMAIQNGEAVLEDCLFEGNVSSSPMPMAGGAGGLFASNTTVSLERCDFLYNRAGSSFDSGGRGGGMIAVSCAMAATACTFRGNQVSPSIMSSPRGGGLFVEDGTAELADCLFVENAVIEYGEGGAVATYGAPNLVMTNCTLQHNNGLGAVHLRGGTVSLERSIIADSHVIYMGGEEPGVAFIVDGGAVTLSACDVFGHTGGDWVGPIADQRYLRGNFTADPCYCDAAGGDFRLCADSACAPENNPWGQNVLVGAFDVGCASCGCSPPVGIDEGRDPGATPRTICLHGATPNPFNPRTTIRFDLPAAGPVRLAVYDLAGRLVRVLVEGERAAGSHEAVWDGRNEVGQAVASGSYFARIEADGKTTSGRMSLVR